MPKISVIIPVYNADKTLNKCLDSILKQTHNDFEVLIIDDGSIDNTKDIYTSYVKKDERFMSFFQKNQGPSSARNLGIEKASGNYIAFIDADDHIHANYLQDLINSAISNNAKLTCCGYFELSKYNKEPYPVNDFYKRKEIIDRKAFIQNLFNGTSGVLWAKLFDAQIIKENNLQFDPHIKMSEDLVFILEYAFFIDLISVVNKNNYYYNRLNESGISSQQDSTYIKDVEISNKAIDVILEKNKYHFPETDAIKTKRLLSLLKTLTNNIAISKNKISDKKDQINEILSNDYVASYFKDVKHSNIFSNLQLLFLKRKYLIIFIFYCKLLDNLRRLKQFRNK